MNSKRLRSICLVLLVLVILTVSISTTPSMVVRASCCVQECVPCIILGKLHGSVRQFAGALRAFAMLMVLLALAGLALGVLLERQDISNLVTLKMRLNN